MGQETTDLDLLTAVRQGGHMRRRRMKSTTTTIIIIPGAADGPFAVMGRSLDLSRIQVHNEILRMVEEVRRLLRRRRSSSILRLGGRGGPIVSVSTR